MLAERKMELLEKLLSIKNNILEKTFNEYLSSEESKKDFFENKNLLTAILEISSIANRYIKNENEKNKLRKLLYKNIIISIVMIEMIMTYSKMFKNSGLPFIENNELNYYSDEIFTKLELDKPTILSPFLIEDTNESNLVNTIGVLSCNLAIGIWSDFKNNDYRLISLIERFSTIKEGDEKFCIFILKYELYLLSVIKDITEDELKEILPTVFFVKKKINNEIFENEVEISIVGQVVQDNNSTIEQTEINQDGIISLEKTASYEEYNSGNKRKVIIKEQIITNNKDNIPQAKINTIKL